MYWTPPSKDQINSSNNPFRHLTRQQLFNETFNNVTESKSGDMFDLILKKGMKLGDWNMQSFFYYEGNIWMLKNGVATNSGPASMFRKRMNQSLIKALDPKLKEVEGMHESVESDEISHLEETITEAGSAKEIHKKLMQKGVVAPIDASRYPERKGLEGPYRNKKSGKVFYYDPKEGKYYDPNSDIYLDVSDVMEEVNERELTPGEVDKKEKIVKSLKNKKDEFEKKYGDRAKEVMYAVATKMAKEDLEENKVDVEESVSTIAIALTKIGIPFKEDPNRKGVVIVAKKFMDKIMKMFKVSYELGRGWEHSLVFEDFENEDAESITEAVADKKAKFKAGVPLWFRTVFTGLPKYPTQQIAGWKTELKTGSGMPGYITYVLHYDGLGKYTVYIGAGYKTKILSNSMLGTFSSPEEAMKFVEGHALHESKFIVGKTYSIKSLCEYNDDIFAQITSEGKYLGRDKKFGRHFYEYKGQLWIHHEGSKFITNSGSVEVPMNKRMMKGLVKEQYTWDSTTGEYVRTDGGEDPMVTDVIIHRGGLMGSPLKDVQKYANTRERNIKRSMFESVDNVLVRELLLFIENDANTYRQRVQPIIKNLGRKMKNGSYDPELAIKGFLYAVEHGIKEYVKQFGDLGKVSKNDKLEVARQLLDGYMDEIEDAAGII